MLGVSANSAAIVIGAVLGLFFRRLVTAEVSQRIEQALGFCILLLGVKMALQFQQVLILILPLAALAALLLAS